MNSLGSLRTGRQLAFVTIEDLCDIWGASLACTDQHIQGSYHVIELRMLKAGLPLPKRLHLCKKTVNNNKAISAKWALTHIPCLPLHLLVMSQAGKTVPHTEAASLWGLLRSRAWAPRARPPSLGLLPLPNKVRIYNFFHGNIWLISLEVFFFFLFKAFISSNFFSVQFCVFCFPPSVFFADSEAEAEDVTHSNNLG